MGARLNRGSSKQDYGTPPEFLKAVKDLLKIYDGFALDVAASHENAKADRYIVETTDSLADDILWDSEGGWNWLNPPFGNIRPWVAKARQQTYVYGFRTAVLVPASVGSNWWSVYVDRHADVHFLNGRITFEGAKDPYPKDCALLLYHPAATGGYTCWAWQKEF